MTHKAVQYIADQEEVKERRVVSSQPHGALVAFSKDERKAPAKTSSSKPLSDRPTPVVMQQQSATSSPAGITPDEDIQVPETYIQAMSSPQAEAWALARDAELKQVIARGTWILVPRPGNRRIVKCKWVWSLKTDAEGHLLKHKARIVAKGFTQVDGIDYHETYAPVAAPASIRAILALATRDDLDLEHIDVTGAFLYSDLAEEVFMELPHGYHPPEAKGRDLVCSLKKSLYGLKQAARSWFEALIDILRHGKLTQSTSDQCVFTFRNNSTIIMLAVHVDDMVVAHNSPSAFKAFLQHLESKIVVTHQPLSFCLSMEVIRDRSKRITYLRQRKHIIDMLKTHGLLSSSPAKTPMIPDFDPYEHPSTENRTPQKTQILPLSQLALEAHIHREKPDTKILPYDKNIPYRQALGSLLYIAGSTRPDIMYAVSILSQFSSCYQAHHWEAVRRVMKYLEGTINFGLCVSPTRVQGGINSKPSSFFSEPVAIEIYADADWAGDTNDSKSRSGIIIKVAGVPVLWQSKKQTSVASSTTTAEYFALSQAIDEAQCIQDVIQTTGYIPITPTIAYQDNLSTIQVAASFVPTSKGRHLRLKFHGVRDKVQSGEVKLIPVSTEQMDADIMTKAQKLPQYLECRNRLVMEVPTP